MARGKGWGGGPWQRVYTPRRSRSWVTRTLLPTGQKQFAALQAKQTAQQKHQAALYKASVSPLVTANTAAKRAAMASDVMSKVPGFNDVYPTCSALAIAYHLATVTGIVLADDEILALHRLAGGTVDSGTSIEAALEAARSGGCRVRLRDFFRVAEDAPVPGLVMGISLPHDGHAVLTHPAGMVSWGRLMPFTGQREEAWALEWDILV